MKTLRLLSATSLLLVGATAVCSAVAVAAPEIDPSSGMNAIALLSGALVILRSRRK